MDPNEIFFVRLYKMVAETCRAVIWELLLQLLQPQTTIFEVVEEISEDSATGLWKTLLEYWKKINTTTPIESDFDIANLCYIILFILKKEDPNAHFKQNIIAIRKIRNQLAHTGHLLMSEEEYQNQYEDIRNHVDLLESTINSNYNPDRNCKWIRKKSSKYLNKIDRIHKEYTSIDPDILMEIKKLTRQWEKEITDLQPEQEGVEVREEPTHQTEQTLQPVGPFESLTTTTESFESEVENGSQKDQYEKDIAEKILQEMDDILGQADENETDINEQMEKQQADRSRQQLEIDRQHSEINELQKSINSCQNQVVSDTRLDNIAKCEKKVKEKIDLSQKKYEQQCQFEEEKKMLETETLGKRYEYEITERKKVLEHLLSKQRKVIDRDKDKLDKELERDIAAIAKGDDMEIIIKTMKNATELKKKELVDSFDETINKMRSNFEETLKRLEKEKHKEQAVIEKNYKDKLAYFEKEYTENKISCYKSFMEQIASIKFKSDNLD